MRKSRFAPRASPTDARKSSVDVVASWTPLTTQIDSADVM